MVLIGPAVAGVLLGLGGAGLALAVFAGLLLGATLLSVGLEAHPLPASNSPRPVSEAAAGFRAVARHPDQRLVVGLLVGQSVIAGALDVLIVVIVLGLFGLPSSAAGYLSAARGAGGLLGGLWAFSLIGKPRLAAAMALGLVVFGFGTAALALAVVVALAAAFLVVVGSGYARADIAGRTLLLRVVPDEILTRVFGVLEGMNMAGLAAGGALAPLLVAALGVRSGTLVAGLLLPATVLILSPRIRALDRAVRIPEQELSILRSVDLLAPLENPMMEAVASRLRHVEVLPGAVIMRKGEPGNRFYVIADGEVEVTRDGRPWQDWAPVPTSVRSRFFGMCRARRRSRRRPRRRSWCSSARTSSRPSPAIPSRVKLRTSRFGSACRRASIRRRKRADPVRRRHTIHVVRGPRSTFPSGAGRSWRPSPRLVWPGSCAAATARTQGTEHLPEEPYGARNPSTVTASTTSGLAQRGSEVCRARARVDAAIASAQAPVARPRRSWRGRRSTRRAGGEHHPHRTPQQALRVRVLSDRLEHREPRFFVPKDPDARGRELDR
jgi:hypothetical protein